MSIRSSLNCRIFRGAAIRGLPVFVSALTIIIIIIIVIIHTLVLVSLVVKYIINLKTFKYKNLICMKYIVN